MDQKQMTPFQQSIYDLLEKPMTYEELLEALANKLGRTKQRTAGAMAMALIAMYNDRRVIRPDQHYKRTV